MNGNSFVTWMLKSPLHPLMGSTLLLTVTGRKSGRKISVPVNYFRDGNDLWIVSKRDRTWWRNLKGSAPVSVRLQGHEFPAVGEAIVDDATVLSQLGQYVRMLPASARYLGVRLADGVPNADDLQRAANERVFVHICLVG